MHRFALLCFGFKEPAGRAPKRRHTEHASPLEAQPQPEASYRIAFDPPALHAVGMAVRVVSDEPLLHARLALWAVASASRHNMLPLLIRTVSTAGACGDCGVSCTSACSFKNRTRSGLVGFTSKALDPISVLRGATRLLDSGAAHFNADASQLIHPPVLVGVAIARSIYRYLLMLENERSARSRWEMPQAIGGHNFFISPTVEPEPPPSACVSFPAAGPSRRRSESATLPQWRTGASFPREAPFSLENFYSLFVLNHGRARAATNRGLAWFSARESSAKL